MADDATARVFLWGVSHQTAPLAVRELWTLSDAECAHALPRLREAAGGQVVALSTCNRTEFYFYTREDPPLAAINTVLSTVKGREADLRPEVFYHHGGAAVVRHLFAVASGLDSQILGETEIQGQVKQALALAREAGACGGEMGRLFDHALRAGKRVRTDTHLSVGVLSAGQAGVMLAGKVLGDLARVEALLVGSGEIGRMTARALVAQGIRALRVTSRTEEHARALAEEFAARVVPFADVLQAAAACDLVISSTAAPGVIFEKAALAPLLRRRADRPLVIIDLAVPRDVASDVAGIDNVFLHDLDDLEAVLAQSRLQRACELPRCELIIDEEVQKFLAMHAFRREIEPVIRRLVDTVEIWQRAEVEGAVAALEPAAAEAVRAVVRRLTRRVLLFPINRLKALRDRGALAPETLAVLREIFEANADADDQDRHAR